MRQAKIKLTSQRGKRVLNNIELGQLLRWLPDSALYRDTKECPQNGIVDRVQNR